MSKPTPKTKTKKVAVASKAKKKYGGSSKAKDLRDKSAADLEKLLADAKAELLDLRIRKGTSQVDNPIRLRVLRRDIARINTIAAQKKVAA